MAQNKVLIFRAVRGRSTPHFQNFGAWSLRGLYKSAPTKQQRKMQIRARLDQNWRIFWAFFFKMSLRFHHFYEIFDGLLRSPTVNIHGRYINILQHFFWFPGVWPPPPRDAIGLDWNSLCDYVMRMIWVVVTLMLLSKNHSLSLKIDNIYHKSQGSMDLLFFK